MCGIIGYVGRARGEAAAPAGPRAARVPRLRLRRHRAARGRRTRLRPRGRQPPEPEGRGRPERLASHAPASATRAGRRTAASPSENAHPLTGCDDAQARDRAQRDRRELPRAARGAARRRAHVHVRDRRRGRRAPARARLRRRPRRRRCARVYPQLEGHFTIVVDPPRPPEPCSSACATRRRSSSASATARTSSPRTSRRSSPRRAACSSPTTARSSRSRPTASRFFDATAREVEHRRRGDRLGRRRRREGAATRRSCSRRSTSSPKAVRRDDRRPRPRTASSCSRALGLTEDELRNLRRIVIVACGTAYHAGVVGRYIIEEWARVPVEPDIASEWIYRNPVLDQGHARDRHLAVGRDARHDQRDEARARDAARARSRSRT